MNYIDISELNPEKNEKLLNDLTKLVALEMQIQSLTSKYTVLTRDDEASVRDKIKEWFGKALEIAKEFQPREFTVSAEIGFPPRIGASFTWSTPRD